MRVSKQIEVLGEFWLPSNPAKKVSGKLTINSNGKILLEITKAFVGRHSSPDNPQSDLFSINGEVNNLGFVRLVECFYIRMTATPYGPGRKSLIHVNFAVCAVEHQKEEEITFSTFSFSVDRLNHWLDIRGAEIKRHDNKNISIKYSPPKSIDIKLNEEMKIQIGFYVDHADILNGKIKITQISRIHFLSEKPKSLLYFVYMVQKINTFLCMATNNIVCIKDVSATDPENNEYDIYYQSSIYTETPAKWDDGPMLFNFHSIKENAPAVFREWIDNYEHLEPTYSLYLFCQTREVRYVNFEFLFLVQSLENLWETMQVLDGCSKQKRTLNGKLKKLIFTFKNLISSDSRSTWGKVIADIVGIRNYLTHYTPKHEFTEKAKNVKTLHFLCQKMNVIIQLHFLRQSKFSDEKIKEIMDNCPELKYTFYGTERKL